MGADARIGLRGYVSSRPFGGFVIPVPLQSLALRDYCARRSKIYVLPANENSFPHSYMVLEGLVADLSAYEGVVMYSMHMLPQKAERRVRAYRRILDQGCHLHLVLEDFVVSTQQSIERVEELIQFAQLSARPPQSFALD